jgi:hypothetical protein
MKPILTFPILLLVASLTARENTETYPVEPIRLEVLVTGSEDQPLCGASVVLLDGRGQQVWTAITGVDGHATLLDEFGAEKSLSIVFAHWKEERALEDIPGEVLRIKLPVPCREEPERTIDIAWAIDVTGSMQPWLDQVREVLGEVINNQQWKGNARHAALAFSDRGERFLFKECLFADGAEKVLEFLNPIRAVGGGDDAEPLDEAINKALQMDWSDDASVRVLFLITDALPARPDREVLIETAKRAAARGVRVAAFIPPGTPEESVVWLSTLASFTGGSVLQLGEEPLARVLSEKLGNTRGELNPCPTLVREAPALSIAPNPAEKKIKITCPEWTKSVVIHDQTGRGMFKTDKLENETLSIDISGWPAGTYTVKASGFGNHLVTVMVKI